MRSEKGGGAIAKAEYASTRIYCSRPTSQTSIPFPYICKRGTARDKMTESRTTVVDGDPVATEAVGQAGGIEVRAIEFAHLKSFDVASIKAKQNARDLKR